MHCDYCTATPADCYTQISSTQSVADQHDDIMMTSYHSSTRRRYVAHPFRLYGIGKTTDITLAQQAYEERHSPCNDGWCQDIIQAAMLNMTDAAALQLAGRASASPVRGKRRLFAMPFSTLKRPIFCQDRLGTEIRIKAEPIERCMFLSIQAKGFRFPGFAAHYQDYEPSLDHYGFMRTGAAAEKTPVSF